MYKYSVVPQVLIAIIASIGSIIYGIGLGWSSPSGPKILSSENNFQMTNDEFAWSVSITSFGGASACFITGILRDRLGTKISMLIFTIPSLAGWILLTFAQNSWMIIIGRFLNGIAAGAYSFNVLVYIGEIASKEIRGILLSFYEISIKVGILFVYILGSVTDLFTMNAICAFIVLSYGVMFMFLPESPIFLVKHQKIPEARKSLNFLRGSKNATEIEEELETLQRENEELEATKTTFCQEIRNKATRNAFIMLFFVFLFFQMSGINAVVFYTTTILIESGIKIDPFLATCFLGLIQVLSICVSIFFVDRSGRKILLIVSNAVMIVGLVGVGCYFQFKESSSLIGFEWLPILFLCIFLAGFSFGVGSVSFVLLGEMFSMNAKKIIAPLAQVTNFLMSFGVALSFPMVADYVGMEYTFYLFAVFCFIAMIYEAIVLPETKGKSLAEIQRILTNRKEK